MNPDGVELQVPWDSLRVGYSVFIPCVDTEKAKTQAKALCAMRGWKVKVADRIERGCLGIRVWRMA